MSIAGNDDYRVIRRFTPTPEYHPPDGDPKLLAAIVDVETTGTNPDHDKIIELAICLFEFEAQTGRIYRVLDTCSWLEDPGEEIQPEITKITGITNDMVAGHRIDDTAVTDSLGRVVLVIAHNANFDRKFLERRIPAFAGKHWACSRSDIDWSAEGVSSTALEFIAYRLGFFYDPHRAASDCRAALHVLAQPLPTAGQLVLHALLEKARQPTWRLWPRDSAFKHKETLKARGYSWSAGDLVNDPVAGRMTTRPKCWYRDVADPAKAEETAWLRTNVMGPGQAVWALRITAKERYSDRCFSWGEVISC